MKITSVDVIALERDPGCLSRPVLCRVNTGEGIYGIGEAGVAIGTGSPAAFRQIKDIAPIILGADPMDSEVLWEKMFRKSFWAQGGGAIELAAISALDTALWDIKAKAANAPLYKLLGGAHRKSLRCYASQLQFGWAVERFNPLQAESGEPSVYAEAASRAASEGYTAIKANFMRFDRKGGILPYIDALSHLDKGFLRLVEARIRATREAAGPDVEIIMENHAMTDAASALQIAKIAEPYDIMFYEEPSLALNPAVLQKIARNTAIPLATGERTYTRWGFLPLLEAHCLGVIQPDIGNCGGVTEAKKICDMALVYDVGVQTHVCSSPVSVAVSLHLEAAITNFIIHEHHVCNTLPSTVAQCVHDYQPVNGYIAVPQIPGHGNDISESALKGAHIEAIKL
jgi:L-alanine-DL-glutamate epimerase-like enolase superfamily enzyme